MACCCQPGTSARSAASCLGRCDLPKHHCLERASVKPGPIPRYMGWHYTAKDSPAHQLRCGWRPGHIACPVLRKIEQHNCMKSRECTPCPSKCTTPCPRKPCCSPVPCPHSCPRPCPVVGPPCPSCPSTPCCKSPPCDSPLIRICRHGGQYTISTEPSNISNSPAGPYPLKYVLNTADDDDGKKAKYSIEAKFNDYQFDYTSSQTSFVLDFTPPEQRCFKPCPKKSLICIV